MGAGEAVASDWLDVAPAQDAGADDWLEINGDGSGTVKSAKSMPYDSLKFACMRGTDRVWACDGHYVAYRPFNRAFDKEVNPRTRERHEDFLAAGHYKHLGTFDEVQIFELLDGSPFKTVKRDYIVGRDYWADIRQAAQIACRREWTDFHDFLEAMARGIKHGRTAAFAESAWQDALNQIMINIYQRQGPLPVECAAGIANVRSARGLRRSIVLPNPASGVVQKEI